MANTFTLSTAVSPALGEIHALLAGKGYSVTETGESGLRIQEVDSGLVLQAVLSGEIMFFSVVCMTPPSSAVTPAIMRKMLDADNGISTSHFQLYDKGDGTTAITLNNFCKLQELGADDEDDILACVSFLLADVVHARQLIGDDLHSA